MFYLTPVRHPLSSGKVFVVQWERVRLLGKESEGAFTFQATLYKTGAITFSYRDVRHNLYSLLFVAFSELFTSFSFSLHYSNGHLFVCLPDTAVIRRDQFSSASSEGGFV